MRLDIRRTLRRLKPEKQAGGLERRADAELQFVGSAAPVGPTLLLDTTVYIDMLEGSTPPEVDKLVRTRTLTHLSVVLAELAHNFGRLDPSHPDTPAIVATLTAVFDDIPPHRIEVIGAAAMVEAGILAGLLFRRGRLQAAQQLAALNDAAIYLHALERGHTVLTRNIRDFDFLQQIRPSAPPQVLFYRCA